MRLVLVCLCLCVAACETTSFQAPPVAERGCDPALVGDWLSIGDKPEDEGEVEMRIDGHCRLLVIEHEKDGDRVGDDTALHVGSDAGKGYLWVDAGWAGRRFEIKPPAPEGDVYLVRYRIKGDRLSMELPDDRAIAHRIIDDRIKGEVHRTGSDLQNRVLAPLDPAVLQQRGFFDKEKAELRRKPGTSHD